MTSPIDSESFHFEQGEPSRFDRWLLASADRPVLVMVLIAVLTAISVLGFLAPEIVRELFEPPRAASGGGSAAADGAAKPAPLPNVEAVSLTDADAVLVLSSEHFFTPDGAQALREIVQELERLDHVRSVLWMDNVPVLNIFGLRESLFPRAHASDRQFAAARENAVKHPLVGGQLLSDDGRTVLMMVRFNWVFVESDEACTADLKRAVMNVAERFPDVGISVMLTGKVPGYLTYIKAQRTNRRFFQTVGYSSVAMMAVVLFRGVRAVLIVATAPLLGVVWTLGILGFFELRDNPFNDIVLPILLSLVGLTDGVHLMVQIRRFRGAGLDERAAAKAGLRKVGMACALTSVTTAIGFASLALAHHQVVREFGWSCVLGVLLTFVSVILVIPLACSTRLASNIHLGQERGIIDRHLARVSEMVSWTLKFPKTLTGIAIVSTAVLVSISLRLRPDERQINALPAKSEAYLAIRHMDQVLGGLEQGAVDIRWGEDISPGAGEILEVIGEVDDLLEQEDLIGHPLSLRDFIAALPGSGTPAQRMSLVELLPPPLKRGFFVPERRYSVVNFRVQDLGIARYGEVFQRIEAGLADVSSRHPNFQLELRGPAVSRWRDLYQIVVDLAMSLGSASVVIFGVLMLAYRSVRLGLIAVVPNLFPLAVTGAFLVFTGQSLEIASVCAFTVCLGIAVDDTIHFLSRFLEERRTCDVPTAIQRAFTGTGTALLMTSIVLVVGFATVLFSDMRDQRIFATMGALTIISALLGDLLFLPAMLACFAKRDDDSVGRNRTNDATNAATRSEPAKT